MKQMKSALSSNEKALLADIETFSENVGKKGWRLQNRVLKSENLSRIKLFKALFEDVDILNTNLSFSRLEGCRFQEVRFVASNFTGAVIADCQFSKCDLSGVLFSDASIRNCAFVDCYAKDLRVEKSSLSGCIFEKFEDLSSAYEKSAFHDCRFQSCKLKGSAFTWVNSSPLHFIDCDISGVNMGEMNGKGVSFHGGVINGSGIESCSCDEIKLEKCGAKGLTLTKINSGDVILHECNRLESFNILDSVLNSAAVESCKLISEFRILNSKLKEFSILDSRMAYLSFRESELTQRGNMTGNTLAGCSFLKSKIFNLKMSNCSIEDYLILTGARFNNLSLDKITYGKKLEIDAKDVQYVESNRFPE